MQEKTCSPKGKLKGNFKNFMDLSAAPKKCESSPSSPHFEDCSAPQKSGAANCKADFAGLIQSLSALKGRTEREAAAMSAENIELRADNARLRAQLLQDQGKIDVQPAGLPATLEVMQDEVAMVSDAETSDQDASPRTKERRPKPASPRKIALTPTKKADFNLEAEERNASMSPELASNAKVPMQAWGKLQHAAKISDKLGSPCIDRSASNFSAANDSTEPSTGPSSLGNPDDDVEEVVQNLEIEPVSPHFSIASRHSERTTSKKGGSRSMTIVIDHSAEQEEEVQDKIMRRAKELSKENARFQLAQSKFFNGVISCIIVVNTLYLGVEAQIEISDGMKRREGVVPPDRMWWIGDIVFTVVFVAEMILRVLSDRTMFFFGREKYWNLFDSIIVMSSVIEKMAEDMAADINVLRALRVLRIVRLLRVGKAFKPIKAILSHLQCILYSISASVESFISAMITVFVVLYIFGLIFMSGVKSYMDQDITLQDAEVVAEFKEFYGTVSETMWTLVAAITGGVDWMDVARPIMKAGYVYKVYFLCFILFVTIGLLNILTGIFVNCAMQASAMNREIAIDEAIANRDSIVKEVVELFLEADSDGSGNLSWDEFENFIQDTKIKAFFMALELDMSSAGNVFHLLDESGDGTLDAQEFVQGCIAMRGFARKVDISLLMRNNALIMEKMEKIEISICPAEDPDDEAVVQT
jgi:voltage-gated sodium channel